MFEKNKRSSFLMEEKSKGKSLKDPLSVGGLFFAIVALGVFLPVNPILIWLCVSAVLLIRSFSMNRKNYRIKNDIGNIAALGFAVICVVLINGIRHMDLPTAAQHIINGLSLGSLYALIAIGYTMVYGMLRLINFAHGDIVMMAAYFCVFGIASFHIPWYFTFILVVAATVLLGVAIEKVAYRPLRDAPRSSILISAIGVSFLLENFATFVFSGKPKAFPEIPVFMASITLGPVNTQLISLLIPVVTVLFLTVLLYVINNTKFGMAMRAVSKDYETAKIMGIRINSVITVTFAIGSSLAAVGAVMWGMKYPQVQPMMGVMPGLKCFIAAVIGGIGNIKGSVIGGFLLGLGEILLVASLPALTGYRDAFAFIMLIIILLYKPTGLLGEKTTDKV